MTRHDWKDINFTAVIHPGNSYFDFKLYEIKAEDESGTPSYETTGGDWGRGDQTEVLDTAQIYASGSIKWDGCSNVYFDEQDQVMLHFCGRYGLRNLTEAFERLYDLACSTYPEHAEMIGTRNDP